MNLELSEGAVLVIAPQALPRPSDPLQTFDRPSFQPSHLGQKNRSVNSLFQYAQGHGVFSTALSSDEGGDRLYTLHFEAALRRKELMRYHAIEVLSSQSLTALSSSVL